MSLFKEFKSRQIQKKAYAFIESLKNKSEKQIEQLYLDNKEFENNEIVLSYLFFNHTSLIRILPVDFQITMLNSNLTMFDFGSTEAKRKLVSAWLHGNKFFMNALVVGFDEEEYSNYIRLYFKQPEDVALLFMDDLRKVIKILSDSDIKQTELLIESIKDKLVDRQWEFIIEVNPIFIKYASQEIQNKYSEDEKYAMYLNGEAREKYVEKQLEKVKEDISLLDTLSVDLQREYIAKYPYMINYLSDDVLIELLKYDIELIKYVNLTLLRNDGDKTQEVICKILENLETKSNKDIVNILIHKCLLNAKGKVYRFDPNSNDISYQYTKRIIKLLQDLSISQIITLISIDVNYILPYVLPVYNKDTDRKEKEKIIIDANYRCLRVFKSYYGEEYYSKFYRVINKIYNEYIANIDKYDYEKDYDCIFELLKVLFNKRIIENNNPEKVTIFIGTSLLYKGTKNESIRKARIKLLNDLLSNAYNKQIINNRELYNINSLELFDNRLSFISEDLLLDYSKYNFVNISSLLLISKSDKALELFKDYYEIIVEIFGESKESLYKAIENFNYYREIIKNVKYQELSEKETENLVVLLSTYRNPYDITKKEELENYDIIAFKNLVNDLSALKDEDVYMNVLCNYLYNRGYDEKGNSGWLETDTVKGACDIFDKDTFETLEIDGEKLFTQDEIDLFSMTDLLFSVKDFDLIISFISNIISNHVPRDIISVNDVFNKIKKFKVELINNQIVSLGEIEELYTSRPDIVLRNERDGVEIYTIVGQDFNVLCSTNDDGVHFMCTNVSKLEKNAYGYSKLIKDGSIRFTAEDDKTIIKFNKDSLTNAMKPDFILVVGKLSDELFRIAKDNELKIVEVQNG